ncbi:hypothetical protein [Actinoalloteichus hymeniacidonis]|uniref:Uncharacterized protein n=1 Tax=Actinoalloteichus hymeniacidonis TaxID=340345 RepID=A0AAC9HN94_9PSEU|nr:hypothetical protein [Actinoalloteichus hymeniacidonis]AOS62410.1 hypothetical protein TL08_07965 [Actinoalloteichus hymeniacidonis]MBB5909559.1 hypothetical protein [Actinoalloteichus hymeniacidonis]
MSRGDNRGALPAVVMVLAVVAGCADSAHTQGAGPLQFSETVSRLCAPAVGDNPRATRVEPLWNRGTGPVVIEEITLTSAEGMTLVEAVLVPVPGTDPEDGTVTLVPANDAGYPPSPETLGSSFGAVDAWAAREQTVGATIEPDKEFSLAVGLEAADGSGSIKAIRAVYRDEAGRRFEAVAQTEVRIPRCAEE